MRIVIIIWLVLLTAWNALEYWSIGARWTA